MWSIRNGNESAHFKYPEGSVLKWLDIEKITHANTLFFVAYGRNLNVYEKFKYIKLVDKSVLSSLL